MKALFERFLLASRWALIPFYIGLVLALVELLAKVVQRVYQVAMQFFDLTEEGVLLSALSVVDLTLSASLIVIVMLSGYANFVSRFDVEGHVEWPRWIADIDFSELKVKLMASIVAITAIKLLEAFMDAGHELDRDLGWQTGIHIAFVVSALLVAVADRIGNRHGGGGEVLVSRVHGISTRRRRHVRESGHPGVKGRRPAAVVWSPAFALRDAHIGPSPSRPDLIRGPRRRHLRLTFLQARV